MLVFIDADLTGWGTHFVTGLLGPLLTDADIALVKGFYDRVLDDGSSGPVTPQGGGSPNWSPGRCSICTGRSSRPSCSRWPASGRSGVGVRELSVPVGYGVELAVLLDVVTSLGWTPWPRSISARGRTRTSRCTTSA